jgi:carboxypeptidase family protein
VEFNHALVESSSTGRSSRRYTGCSTTREHLLTIPVWTLALFVTFLSSAQQTPPPRDAPTASPGIATVRGRVISAATAQPLHRVRVTLNGDFPNPPTGVTDTRGEFELTNVPSGTYTLTASRAGYLTLQYGQRRPLEVGRTIEVRSGQVVEKIEMLMFRGGVLAGRITDELGDAAPGVRVEAIELRYVRGRRVPVPARIVSTNDAGEYRLNGLEPGSYQVRATSAEMWEGDDGKQTFVYAPTLFPSVSSTDQAQSISLSVGQEVSGLDFGMIAGRAARITGVVEDTNSSPLAAQVVNLDTIMRTTGGALQGAGFGGSTKTDERGAFQFPTLAPGEYMVYTGARTERVAVPAVLKDADVKHVVLTPRKPAAVAGVLVTDENTPPPFSASRVRVNPVSADPESVLPVWGSPREQSPRPDWTFRIPEMQEGQYLFRVAGLPDDWMLKSAILHGRDLIDTPLDITRGAPDTAGVQLVVSRKGARITGEVVDGAGAPAADSTVIVFAESRALWGVASRFIRVVRPDDKGRFSLAGLPPGVYRVVAREFVIEGEWEDPEFLQGVMRDAIRLELAEAASETIKLRLAEAR